jgi:serine/threonine-protein kinase RsbW
MRFLAQLDNLPQMMEFIRMKLKEAQFGTKEISHIELASEEALVNVIKYAYKGKQGEIEISCHILGPKQIEVEIRDWGIPFDPTLDVETLDTTSSLEEREVGGLGVYFMFQMMDEVKYTREENANVLRMSKGVSISL